ncbi:MAG: class I SAM-dependent methyltransferase [Candidatus Pacearchaeota archaeon]
MKKQTWNKFWKEYEKPSEAENWLIEERHKVLMKLINLINKKNKRRIKILEVGCGFASNSRLLLKEKFDVYCLDKSKVVINKIKKDLKNSFVGNAFNLPFKNESFDIVFSAGLLEHFHKPEGIIKEMIRVTKKDGIILNFVPGRYSLWQLFRFFHGKNWKHGYEENYTHNKLFQKTKNNIKDIKLILKGGLDPFSINGLFIKIFKRRFIFKIPTFNENAFTEIYQAYQKF